MTVRAVFFDVQRGGTHGSPTGPLLLRVPLADAASAPAGQSPAPPATRGAWERAWFEAADLSVRCRRATGTVPVQRSQTAALERWARDEDLPVDVIGSSAGWGVEKPSRVFFERVVDEAGCEPGEVAYVGDRVDNDVAPAADAGLVAVHVRRGPWGYLQRGAERAHVRVDTLAELPQALARV